MEFNVELLEEIILGISSLENVDQAENHSVEEAGRAIDNSASLNHAVSSARKELTGRESLRLNPSQLIEARSATQTGGTPRTATERDVIEKTTARTPRTNTTPRAPGNVTPRGTNSIDDSKARKAKTLFDELCGKTGLENAMKWFEAHAVSQEREMPEGQFMQFIQSLTKFYEWEVYEILDILDRNHTGTITWEAFYIILSLYTAYSSKRLTKFLYKHGMTVFQFLLDPVTKRLNFERFSRLGFLVGLSEDDILETCLVFGFRKSAMEMMGQEDFILFYFSIFHTIDTGVDLLRDTQTGPYTSNLKASSAQVSSKATPTPGAPAVTAGAQAHQKCTIS